MIDTLRDLSASGTYALVLHSRTSRRITIGRLGKLNLEPGFYIYVGSAFGPGGLKARLSHHFKKALKPHWHIDYLRRYTRVIDIWYTADLIRREDDWVRVISDLPNTAVPMPGFGGTDCDKDSHLFSSMIKPEFTLFENAVMKVFPNHASISLVHRHIPGFS